MRLKAGAEVEGAFTYRTRVAGPLTTEVRAAGDTFAPDNVATLELPALPELPVTVCSPEPTLLTAVIETHPTVKADYKLPAQCMGPVKEGVVVMDRFTPPWKPETPALYIEPSGSSSPVTLRAPAANVTLDRWDVSHPVGEGLHTSGLSIASTQIFSPAA